MLFVLLAIHVQQWQVTVAKHRKQYSNAEPHSHFLKTDDFLSHRFAGVLSFSMLIPSNVLSIQVLFPYPQLCAGWYFTKHGRKAEKRQKQDLTSGIDWIDSTKLSNNDSQIASFTAIQRWQSRTLWEVYIIIIIILNLPTCRFKTHEYIQTFVSKLLLALYNQWSYIYKQIWLGTDTAPHAEPPWVQLSKSSVQILECFCFSSKVDV